ncbi:hypothetical protein C0W54_01960 [Photobacterium kishitanii]|uniref:hypothetical protein n=1 Tax=Photobacterium kishitanii TaxID=318456 RepID=UPI000D154A2F|nr:hypothetical protein [Photobacterium kishitanii]PSW63399.1 hypothetical protein C0W54_01960 [Photobacterium kishitanii]
MDIPTFILVVLFCCVAVVSYLYLLQVFLAKEKLLQFDESTKTVYFSGQKVISVRGGSGNYRFIKYIFDNVGRPISVAELEKKVFFGQNVNLVKVLSNTHLPKEIITIFFSVSKDSLTFKNKAFLK